VKRVDVPPIWLAGFLALAWAQARYLSLALDFGGPWTDLAGGLLIGGGLVLIALAVVEFRRHRTTIEPHKSPTALIQTGIFRRSRNPVYLGMTLILAGLILRWNAVPSLVLIPIFVWVIERRFIVPEENRLRRIFRMDFAQYERKVRRWI